MSGYEPIPEPDPDDDFVVPINDDDDYNADQTGAFGILLSSTPAPEFQTAQKEKCGLPKPPTFF